jgi:hypothetical protein
VNTVLCHDEDGIEMQCGDMKRKLSKEQAELF